MAYEMRISDWSSYVCSSELDAHGEDIHPGLVAVGPHSVEQVHAHVVAELHRVGAAQQEVGDHEELRNLQRPPGGAEEDAGEGLVEGGPQQHAHHGEHHEHGDAAEHAVHALDQGELRSEEHTTELQSLM